MFQLWAMTCVIGLREGGFVHMGGDDVITAESDLLQRGASKVVKYPSGLVAGFAGSLATANILARPDDDFIKVVADLDSDTDVNRAYDRLQGVANFQLKGAVDGQFWTMVLLALGPTLVCMGNVAGWYRVKDFRCIGTGGKIATGAMAVLANVTGLTTRQRLETAIDAASRHVPGVGKMTSYETTAPAAGLSQAPPLPPSPAPPAGSAAGTP